MKSIYEKNIEAINRSSNNHYIDKNSKVTKQDIKIEHSKDGNFTAIVNIDGKDKYISSKYSPLKEAKRFIDSIEDYDTETLFIVYGLGLGYHIIELYKNIGEKNKIFVIEPNIELFKKAMEINDFTDLINTNSVHFCVGLSEENLFKFYAYNIDIKAANNFKFNIFSQYDRYYRDFSNIVIEHLKETINREKVIINTLKHFSYDMNKNLFYNFKDILKGDTISILKNKFNNKPAIIVSAGPSLDKNISQLKYAKGKAIIISGGRTLKPLLKNGIKPDLVVSLDPGIGAYKVIKENLDTDIPMVTTVVSHSDVIDEYKGKKIFCNNEEVAQLVEDLLDKKVDRIPQGGSVANMSLSLADYMGCDPMILIGQDLAYTNGKFHADSATLNQKNNKVITENNPIIKDIHGQDVYTTQVWLSFLRWFEEYIETISDKVVIDATEGGAKIKGTKVMTLKETIDKYCLKNIQIPDEIKRHKEIKEIYDEVKDFNKKFKKLKSDLEKVRKYASRGVKYNKKMLRFYEGNKEVNISNVLTKLEEIDKKMEKYQKQNVAINSLVSPTIIKTLFSKNFREKINESDIDRGKRVSNRGYTLYKGIKESIDKIKPDIENSIKRIEKIGADKGE
ncbi:motility associated factor glycosyltransferase family protein [Dethiothermospora halolimnae]|uniref:motility associated factor glycosyltransferase family protein n=1 Tax=Dethiothermospora halolimnae TaxID=3114390 RepID=UPI003CCB93E3